MKIFILEDNYPRIEKFEKHLSMHKLYIAKNYDEAISVLKLEEFDILFLDHDLGEYQKTGYDVATWIIRNSIKYKRAIVHSANPAGAKNIVSVLKNSEHIPFTSLFASI